MIVIVIVVPKQSRPPRRIERRFNGFPARTRIPSFFLCCLVSLLSCCCWICREEKGHFLFPSESRLGPRVDQLLCACVCVCVCVCARVCLQCTPLRLILTRPLYQQTYRLSSSSRLSPDFLIRRLFFLPPVHLCFSLISFSFLFFFFLLLGHFSPSFFSLVRDYDPLVSCSASV